MYVVAIEGQPQRTVDLSGVYRLIAVANPLDGQPLNLDARSVVGQMTCPKDQCVLPTSTRDALHVLVWSAAAGQVTTYRFPDGPAIALKVLAGTEYKPRKEFGEVKPPEPAREGYRVRRYGRS